MLSVNTVAEVEFELREEIGQEGRNSQVFRSYDQALDAELVIKRVNKNSVVDADALFNEARLLYKRRGFKILCQLKFLNIKHAV